MKTCCQCHAPTHSRKSKYCADCSQAKYETDAGAYLPSAADIKSACAEIQATWTRRQRALRDLTRAKPVVYLPIRWDEVEAA